MATMATPVDGDELGDMTHCHIHCCCLGEGRSSDFWGIASGWEGWSPAPRGFLWHSHHPSSGLLPPETEMGDDEYISRKLY